MIRTRAQWDALDVDEFEGWCKTEVISFQYTTHIHHVYVHILNLASYTRSNLNIVCAMKVRTHEVSFDHYAVCTGPWIASIFRFQARLTRTLLQSPRSKWMVYWHDRHNFLSDEDTVVGWLTR